MHNKALSSVWVARYHCESVYCYFGTTSTNLYFYCNEESTGTLQMVEN